MSRRRIVLSVVAGVVALGGAGAFALVHAAEQAPALAHGTARYTAPAPADDRDGSLTFTAEVTSPSGVKNVKVLAWPADSFLAGKKLTAKDMAEAEQARCEPVGGDTVRCAYTTPVTATAAASAPDGAWHVAVLATAKNGTTTLDTEAADFTVA